MLSDFDRHLYVATVILGAVATATLIAPVAFHRFLIGHGVKPELVRVAGHFITTGLVLLALTITTALLLLLRTALDATAWAWFLTGAVLLWFALCRLVLPQVVLRRAERRR